jgi:hypothetical protein
MTDKESPNFYDYSYKNSMTSSPSAMGLTSEALRLNVEGLTSKSLKLKIQKWSGWLAFLPFELGLKFTAIKQRRLPSFPLVAVRRYRLLIAYNLYLYRRNARLHDA